MNKIEQAELRIRYQSAIDQFIDKIRDDINVIAVIVSGSVAYDVIWEKSDVDITIVVRDQKLMSESLSIVEDGITFNVYMKQRSLFKRGMEQAVGGSILQSYLSNGKIVYTTDESLYDFFEDIKQIGEDDMALTALNIANELISIMHKVQKWMTARNDLIYSQYFLLKAAEPIANMELCIRGIPTSRSAIQKAIDLNPEIMRVFYQEPMEHLLTEAELNNGVKLLDSYIEDKMDIFKKPIIEYLSDQEIRTTSMIANHLRSDSHFIIESLDYLSEKGVIEKVSQIIKLTPKSRLSIEEIGFLYIPL
ncbi:nucleotidyltransferase [Pseudobacteroides cellulosolvens]|nr:nucleotidyltransferase [Pseudobacteroides cellulosolvens]